MMLFGLGNACSGWRVNQMLPVVITLLVVVGAGCMTGGSPGRVSAGSDSRTAPAPKTRDAQETPRVERDNTPRGVVQQVNVALRYLVMDFAAWQMPELQDRLGLYRQGRKVGEVLVTGPIMGTTVAGDLVLGEAQPGDAVRLD